MSVGVVVPLDGGQVGVVGKIDRLHQALGVLAPQTGREGEVSQLVKDLMSLTIDRIVSTEELAGVRVVELHTDTAGCVAVTSSVDEVDPSELLGVSPAVRVGPHIAVLVTSVSVRRVLLTIISPHPQHVRHLEVSCDLMDAVLRAHGWVALGNVVLARIGLRLVVHPQQVLV